MTANVIGQLIILECIRHFNIIIIIIIILFIILMCVSVSVRGVFEIKFQITHSIFLLSTSQCTVWWLEFNSKPLDTFCIQITMIN